MSHIYEFRIRRVRLSMACEVDEPLTDPAAAAAVFQRLTAGEAREVFMVASVDPRNRVLGVEKVAIGTLDSVQVHPREVFRGAILAGAAAIVVGHNHPSGDPTPSSLDLDLTLRLREGGDLLGIPVLDHIVVCEGRGNYYSMAERRILESKL